MKIISRDLEGVRVISPAEPLEIDLTNSRSFKELAIEAAGDSRDVVLDAKHVEFFDSSGMTALLALNKHAASRGGRLYITGLNRAIMDIFRMVGFDVVFNICDDLPQAVSRIKKD